MNIPGNDFALTGCTPQCVIRFQSSPAITIVAVNFAVGKFSRYSRMK